MIPLHLYLIVNALILIANIAIFFYQRYEASKLRRIALKDDFWFRSIALPIILERMQDLCDKQTRAFRKLMADNADGYDHKKYLDNCQPDIHDMIDKCHVVQIYGDELYHELIGQLELMEDKIAEYCFSLTLGKRQNQEGVTVTPSLFSQTNTRIISIIMAFHDKNKFI